MSAHKGPQANISETVIYPKTLEWDQDLLCSRQYCATVLTAPQGSNTEACVVYLCPKWGRLVPFQPLSGLHLQV